MRNLSTQEVIKLTKKDIEILLSDENLLPFNREIKDSHTKKMKSSIEKLGVLRLPVLAKLNYSEGELAIADMQHGLSAIYELMSETDSIQAIVKHCETKKEVVDLVAKLNTTSKGWNDSDYLNCWIEFGGENSNYGFYIQLKDRFENTGLSLGLLVDIYTSNKGGFRDGSLLFRDAKKSMIISNFCAYYKSKGFRSFQLTGLSKFLLKNELNEKERDAFKRRINRMEENNLIPKHRDDFRDLLYVIHSETTSQFSRRFE